MKVNIIVTIIMMALSAQAQKYDYRWILGEGGSLGNADVTFTDSTADTAYLMRYVFMENSQTTMSDSGGNLIFFSNGVKIYNRLGSIMLNGDSLNFGPEWQQTDGVMYPFLEDMVALPTDTAAVWNLFHYYVEYDPFSNTDLYTWRIDQSQVDMRLDTGLGGVVFKNKTIVQDTLGSYVTACQHGNGRDWWVLASKTSSNCLYTLLVAPDTVMECPIQCLGANYITGDAGQAAFSPDGTKFAWLGGYGAHIYDFDRCSGLLSAPITLPFYVSFDSSNYQYGLAFSPNSQYLYIAQSKYILQFDLRDTNIAASVDTVGYYTPPPDSSNAGYFFLMQLAPDGKIYVSGGNSLKYLHVINEPDKKGDSCNFVDYGFPLPAFNAEGLPSYPSDYRLGAWMDSPCDTLSSLTEVQRAAKEQILKIYPNPANDYTIVDYGFTEWSKGEVELEICNALGQAVYTKQLPMYSGFQKIDLSGFKSGMYTAFIKRNNGVVASGKVVKE